MRQSLLGSVLKRPRSLCHCYSDKRYTRPARAAVCPNRRVARSLDVLPHAPVRPIQGWRHGYCSGKSHGNHHNVDTRHSSMRLRGRYADDAAPHGCDGDSSRTDRGAERRGAPGRFVGGVRHADTFRLASGGHARADVTSGGRAWRDVFQGSLATRYGDSDVRLVPELRSQIVDLGLHPLQRRLCLAFEALDREGAAFNRALQPGNVGRGDRSGRSNFLRGHGLRKSSYRTSSVAGNGRAHKL